MSDLCSFISHLSNELSGSLALFSSLTSFYKNYNLTLLPRPRVNLTASADFGFHDVDMLLS